MLHFFLCSSSVHFFLCLLSTFYLKKLLYEIKIYEKKYFRIKMISSIIIILLSNLSKNNI